MALDESYDIIIIGGGHNGLTCAAYLAKKGLSVKVFERRGVVGGAAVTEEFFPGFRNSLAAYSISHLNDQVVKDLNLFDRRLRIVERRMNRFCPIDGERFLAFPSDVQGMQDEIAKFSERDAGQLPRFLDDMDRIADLVEPLQLATPPAAGDDYADMLKAAKLTKAFKNMGLNERRLLLDIMTRSAAEVLDMYFRSTEVKAAFAFDAVVGGFTSPEASGSAYGLLHHMMGRVAGKRRVAGHVVGGMGSVSQAIAKAADAFGAEVETGASVLGVVVEGGAATGVLLEDGRAIRARAVVGAVSPKLLFLKMVDGTHLPGGFQERIRQFRTESAALRINVALSQLPSFSCLPSSTPADHHTAGIVIGPSMEYLDRAWRDAREYGWSREPVVEMVIPSTVDRTLAPEGQHVASLMCHHFRYDLPSDRGWDDAREEAADVVVDTIEKYAPGFKTSIIARQILTPLDLERVFGLSGGDINHGRMSLDQLLSARPVLGYGNYLTPVEHLYMCGAGTHPGGGVSGAPGYNAAREIIQDLKKKRKKKKDVDEKDDIDYDATYTSTRSRSFRREEPAEQAAEAAGQAEAEAADDAGAETTEEAAAMPLQQAEALTEAPIEPAAEPPQEGAAPEPAPTRPTPPPASAGRRHRRFGRSR